MRIFLPGHAAVTIAFLAYRACGTRLGENHHTPRRLPGMYTEDKILFLSGQVGPQGEKPCAQVSPKSEEVLVADCSTNPTGTIWDLDADGLLHNILGGCLLAGWAQSPHDGTRLRISKECDDNDPRQQFVFESLDEDGPAGALKLHKNSDLCVTKANDKDFLIMKDCTILSPERMNWSFSYRVYDYLFNDQGISGQTGHHATVSAPGINIQEKDVFLSDNVTEHPSASWYEDTNGMVRNGYGECLQAGHGEVVHDGTHMRVYPCKAKNSLQKFKVVSNHGHFKLKDGYQNLCMTVANDTPILVLKECPGSNVGGRWNWVLA